VSSDLEAYVNVPHPISTPLAEAIAERFRVIGDATRIRILDRLRDGEATVQELTATLGTSQQNVSKHLGVLLHAGVVARRRSGTYAYYAIADETVFALCEQVCGGLSRQLAELSELLAAVSPAGEAGTR
jgi:DNA-binding transcriptional ArsR family regulator